MRVARLFRSVFLTLAVSLLCSAAPAATSQWISLKTPHFEMYTTNSETQALQTLQVLEEVRAFFEQTTSLIQPTTKPVRIMAFRSREEYEPFRLQSTSFAHYLHSRRGDYIVLQDIAPEHRRAAIHEYTHFVFRMAGLQLPIWLCEGTADFYSSFEMQGDRSSVGAVLPSRFRALEKGGLLPLETIFAVDHRSPFYNDPTKVALFYGQSWALVHMLAFHPHYRAQFAHFLQLVSSGVSCPDAFQDLYTKSVDDVAQDLKYYLPELSNNQSTSELKRLEREQPSITPLSEVEGTIAMADLLAAHRSTAGLARNRLEALNERNPGNPKTEELLAYLAAQPDNAR